VLLTAFGTFWGVEGAGGHWPGADLALLLVIAGVLALALIAVWYLRGVRAKQTQVRSLDDVAASTAVVPR
jgi:uncharacterized membrane protein